MQDPKEATRERIERLKKEGAVEFEEAGNDKGAIPPPKAPVLKQGRAAAAEVSTLPPVPSQPCPAEASCKDCKPSHDLNHSPLHLSPPSEFRACWGASGRKRMMQGRSMQPGWLRQ